MLSRQDSWERQTAGLSSQPSARPSLTRKCRPANSPGLIGLLIVAVLSASCSKDCPKKDGSSFDSGGQGSSDVPADIRDLCALPTTLKPRTIETVAAALERTREFLAGLEQAGQTSFAAHKPYLVEEHDGLWDVTGAPTEWGAPYLQICRENGAVITFRVLYVGLDVIAFDEVVTDKRAVEAIAETIATQVLGRANPMFTVSLNKGHWTARMQTDSEPHLVLDIDSVSGAIEVLEGPAADELIPTEETAAAIAKAILASLYGPLRIYRQQPFHLASKDGNWLVEGSRPPGRYDDGGTAEIRLRRSDGKVLGLSHGR